MADEREVEVLTQRFRGQTLSYECERRGDLGSTVVHTHKIIVEGNKQGFWFYLLTLMVFSSIVAIAGAAEAMPFLFFVTALYFWAQRSSVEQERVIVMPTFGVQLETVYCSKNVSRRFVPMHKIVSPVINEAVSPVSCYFYLALLLRDEKNLALTFLGTRPPLKMLVPIWRSLHEAVGGATTKPVTPNQTLR